MNYKLLNFCEINNWISKSSTLPFEFERIRFNAMCIAIMPLSKNIISDVAACKRIKYLRTKMLEVLALAKNNLSIATVYYENKVFNLATKNLLSLKILKYFPKMVLTFGDLDFLDQNLLNSKKVLFNNISYHPEHLLNNIQAKKLAYQELLLCKQKLQNINYHGSI